ncbi:MAG TPA: hypothetical protein VE988_02870 [Gemmataceae bacterium]|nr:hypothetical protein [Gemmataceae bacterium]
MSTPFLDRYSPAFRPTWFDFLFILAGVSISLLLAQWSAFTPRDTDATPAWVKDHVLPFLPTLLFLPVGILLFWPLFFLTQWLRGRTDAMSSGEWLWGVAWLAVLPWTCWVVWQRWDTLPETLQPEHSKRWIFLGYAVGVLALGSLAAILTLLGVFGRWRQPWTHSFCLVLLIWPAIWLACCLAWGIEIK